MLPTWNWNFLPALPQQLQLKEVDSCNIEKLFGWLADDQTELLTAIGALAINLVIFFYPQS